MASYLSFFKEFEPLFSLKKENGVITGNWLTSAKKTGKVNGVYFIVAGGRDWKIGMHTGTLSGLLSRYKNSKTSDSIRHRDEWEEVFANGDEVVFYGYLPPTKYDEVEYPRGTILVEQAIGKALEKEYQQHYIELVGSLPYGNFGENSRK